MDELSGMGQVLELAKQERVRFMRLQFTDILGSIKNVEIPEPQFQRALEGQVVFDGSSIGGFSRERESDMILLPDPATFRVFPWEDRRGKVARMICDIRLPDGSPFTGCPRTALKRVVRNAGELGFQLMVGTEVEFFLFQRSADGKATIVTHDVGGYFDLAPVDRGEEARRDMVSTLERMGFNIEAAHHEVAPGSTRSTSNWRMPWRRPTTSAPAASWCARSRSITVCTPPLCPSRFSGRAAAGFTCIRHSIAKGTTPSLIRRVHRV